MIRSELVQRLGAENPGLAARDIDDIVEAFFDVIIERLAQGGRVELRGFGTFSTRARAARLGRNPRTGSAVEIHPKRAPHFKPGKEIRDKLKLANDQRA